MKESLDSRLMKNTKIISFIFAVLLGLALAAAFVFGAEKLFATVVIPMIENHPKTPIDALVVDFSESVGEEYGGKISITPEIPVSKEWIEGGRKLIVSPIDGWNSGEHYQLQVGEDKKTLGPSVTESFFSFIIPDYPAVTAVFPKDREKDVLLGIEDPIAVSFDRSVKDFFIDFRITPGVSVVYENNPEKTEFRILPKESVKPGTEYGLEVYAKWRGMPDSTYRLLGKTTFTTLPERPKEVNRDLSARIDEAKRYAQPLISEGKYIDVNLKNQVMSIFENGTLIEAFLISSGKRGMDTPKGEYTIHNKAPRPWSKAYGLFMPYWMALVPDGKFGIHELPEWPGGYKEGANHLGTPVSHGCVRLGVGPAKQVYEWAEIGTKVVVY